MHENLAKRSWNHSIRLTTGAIALLCSPNAILAQASELIAKGGITLVHQQELGSGADDTSASGDLSLTLPTASGSWFLYIEGATGTDADSIFNRYPEINGDANSVLDRDGGGH
ncbi:MAG: hypothetical protein KJO19_07540, partial [Woeseia sp.]|nr:hypothetical protein [Woeseia sp.]